MNEVLLALVIVIGVLGVGLAVIVIARKRGGVIRQEIAELEDEIAEPKAKLDIADNASVYLDGWRHGYSEARRDARDE